MKPQPVKRHICRFRLIELSKVRGPRRVKCLHEYLDAQPGAMDVLREGIEAREDWAMDLYFSCLSDRFCPFPELG